MIKNKINEMTSTSGNQSIPDDGPLTVYKDFKSYSTDSTKIGKQLGMVVMRYLVDTDYKRDLPKVWVGNFGGKPLPLDKVKMVADKLGYKILDKYIRNIVKSTIKEHIEQLDKE